MSISLEINNISQEIRPALESNRTTVNWLTKGSPTARGTTTIEGVTARASLFMWTISARLLAYRFLKLERIIDTQQERLGQNLTNSGIILSDRSWYVNAIAATKNNRIIIPNSELIVDGESGKFCRFQVLANIDENSIVTYQASQGMYATKEFSMILEEI